MPDIFSEEVPALLKTHFEHLRSSAISVEVILERGYRTAMGKKALADAGFSRSQQRAPGILIPLHGPDGSPAGHQYRPDTPREGENNRRVKYENPRGASVRLDVPPRCRAALGDPSMDLWFTEGVKKVDALATAGACAVGLTGVWGFKGANVFGGTTVLADFDYITFKDRHCRLVFDSDLASNLKVRQALNRLAEHLHRKGALIHLIFLPAGAGGEKTGADDYLAGGHTLEEMMTLERQAEEIEEPRRIIRSTTQYDIVDGQICWMKSTSEGISEVPLCNFNARIAEDLLRDNGIETTRFFKIEGELPGKRNLPVIETPAAGFNSLNWVTSEWGTQAIIAAGTAAKDRLREAIQIQSAHASRRVLYTHTGWRDIDGEPIFLSGAGAMGREDIEVDLEPPLKSYQLLAPVGDPAEAIKKSLDFLLVANPDASVPLWTCMYLAPLSELLDPAFTLWLVGASGSFKSTLSALALSHFGTFDARHLPASWRDTGNHLEKLLFLLKDMPLVVDDWAPGQDSSKARELEVKAEYIVRAQGNRQGRGRMRSDTSSRPSYLPRGMLITSGEQLPSGHSHTARIYSVDLEKSDVDVTYMGTAQSEQYYYCVAMSHYIAWLKKNWAFLNENLRKKWRDYRDKCQEQERHARLPEVIAWLYCAMELATEYALEFKAVSPSECEQTKSLGWEVFTRLAAKQSHRIEDERPATRALELWRAMLDTGVAVLWNKDADSSHTPPPGQRIIGWFEGSGEDLQVYLDPTAAHGALVEYGVRIGQPFTIKAEALWKDLRRMELIVHTNGHYTCQRRIYGNVKRVITLKNSKVLYIKSGDSGDSVQLF